MGVVMGVVNFAFLACVLRATTEKGRQLYLREKVHPRENDGCTFGGRTAPGDTIEEVTVILMNESVNIYCRFPRTLDKQPSWTMNEYR